MTMNDHLASIIAKKLQGIATPEELAEWQLWMDADPANPVEYEKMAKLWELSGQALHAPSFNTSAAWEKVDSKIMRPVEAPDSTRARRIPLYIKLVGAAAVVLFILYATWYYSIRMPEPAKSFTAQNGHEQIALPDGTTVLLRKGSTLEYSQDFNAEDRHVSLRGEAFFEVIRNEHKPFRIYTFHTVVTVLGTSFLINTQGEADEIVVRSGKVSVASDFAANRELVLTGGKKAILSSKGVKQETFVDSNYISWKTGKLHFQQTSITQVLKEVEHYYTIPVRIDEKSAAEAERIHITVQFDRQPFEQVIDEIRLTSGLSFRKQGDTVIFFRPMP